MTEQVRDRKDLFRPPEKQRWRETDRRKKGKKGGGKRGQVLKRKGFRKFTCNLKLDSCWMEYYKSQTGRQIEKIEA